MGRLIDADAVSEEIKTLKIIFGPDKAGKFFKWVKVKEVLRTIRDIQTIEAIPKADYETRLKADLVAMLEELKTEIEELRLDRPLFSRGYECYGFEDKTPTEIRQECSEIIQEKINELKEDQEGEE